LKSITARNLPDRRTCGMIVLVASQPALTFCAN
jgi:hypothetical protein